MSRILAQHALGVVKFASLDVELPLAAIYEDTTTWANKGRAAASEVVELEDGE